MKEIKANLYDDILKTATNTFLKIEVEYPKGERFSRVKLCKCVGEDSVEVQGSVPTEHNKDLLQAYITGNEFTPKEVIVLLDNQNMNVQYFKDEEGYIVFDVKAITFDGIHIEAKYQYMININ